MVVCGDLIESSIDHSETSLNTEQIEDMKNVSWTFKDAKIPVELFSLYSVESDKVVINDVSSDLFHHIKNSKYSRISAHIHIYEEMFILFFEFAVPAENDYNLVHFGLVPTSDFFTALKTSHTIKIKNLEFTITEYKEQKILEKFNEFNEKYS